MIPKKAMLALLSIILLQSGCNNVYKEFQEAKNLETPETMIQFINTHPDHELADSAKLYLIKYEFQEAKNLASVEAMIQFINNHSDHELADSAKSFLRKYKEDLIKNEQYYITTVTSYDEYDRVSDIVIRNTNGADVARIVFEYNSYNLYQRVAAQIIDVKNGENLHTIQYDVYENPENADVLCLDYDGNILRRDGKAVVVANVNANQKSVSEYQYQGSHVSGITTKTYPCLDCSDILNIPECFFVW